MVGSYQKESVVNSILVVHGPNLNLLGEREPEKYGSSTLDEINSSLHELADELGLQVEIFQSNQEGEIVEVIQKARKNNSAIIINPAAYTHTSVAIRDALIVANLPTIEVHLTNVYARESFRHKSLISDIVSGRIMGFGPESYLLSLRAIQKLINEAKK